MNKSIIYGLDEMNQAIEYCYENTHQKVLLAFEGEVGAGKTTFIKEYLKTKYGCTEEISSPTFSIVNEYTTQNGQTIYHMDLYRIESLQEAYDVGVEEYLYSGNICIIEWPKIIQPILDDLDIALIVIEYIHDEFNKRIMTIK